MAVRIQFRRGTAAEWAAANPTLAAGEVGYEVDTAQFKIGTGAAAWNALSYAAVSESYVDNAIANVIDLAPGTLDTLSELAAAINDDPDFYSTIANSMSTKLSYVFDTEANFNANGSTILAANTVYITETSQIKLGYGSVTWANTSYVGYDYVYNHNNETSVHGIENTLELVTENQVQNLITIHSQETTNVHGILNTADLAYISDLAEYAPLANAALSSPEISDANIANVVITGTATLPADTSIGDISSAEILTLDNVSSNIQNQLDGKLGISDAANTYAPVNNATLTGTVSLPEFTSIGNVTYDEIGHLDNVSSNIQAQLDSKLATSSAASIYAPITDPTFINSVVLPANTSIGEISSTEIGYLENLTFNVQSQLDARAPLNSPTFTGTVSGITKTMVGLENVDNTSDLDKPVSNATQTALDAKLDLTGGTMTGYITLNADPTQALHAATKQYVDNIASGLHIHEAVHVATPSDLATLCGSTVTYDNGTSGEGATLTLGASLSTIDGHSLTNGDRILVKNEATAAHNGIYTRTSDTVLTRADDFNSALEIAGGDFVFVENGTLYNSTGWVVENEVNTVGTDDVLWTQFSGAGSITAGNNISISGTQVSVSDSPTFSGVITAGSGITITANGIQFGDNTIQYSAGVRSLTIFEEKTASYTLDSTSYQDWVIEMNSSSPVTFTIPTNANLAWPIGASMDILQTGTGQVTISPDTGVTLNYTPGNKLRTQWSSCTIMKRGTDSWIVYGDLTA